MDIATVPLVIEMNYFQATIGQLPETRFVKYSFDF